MHERVFMISGVSGKFKAFFPPKLFSRYSPMVKVQNEAVWLK